MMKTPLATIGPRIFQESRIQESEYGLAHSAFLLPHSGSWIFKFLCRCGVFNGVGAQADFSRARAADYSHVMLVLDMRYITHYGRE
jgi:hypothetical protein